jgi:rhodanese-related sulfurtransferase
MKIILVLSIAILLSQSTGYASTVASCESETNYQEVTKAELQDWVKSNSVFLIDANGKDSYKKSHIGNAIDFKTLMKSKDGGKTFASKLPKEKDALIVAYCGGAGCDAWKEAAEEACKMGYTNVKHFPEGLKGWNAKDSAAKKM